MAPNERGQNRDDRMKMRWVVPMLAALAAMPALAQQRGSAIGAINSSLGGVDRGVNAEVGQSGSPSQGGKAPAGGTASVTWGRATSAQTAWGNRARANGAQGNGTWAPARNGSQSASSPAGMQGKALAATSPAKAAPKEKGIKPMPIGGVASAPASDLRAGLEDRSSRFAFTGKTRRRYAYSGGGEARRRARQKWITQLHQSRRPPGMRRKNAMVKEKPGALEPKGREDCENASKLRLCTWL